MSFSSEVKNAIVRSVSNYSNRVDKLICGVLQSSATLRYDEDGNDYIYLSSENASLVKMIKIYTDSLASYHGFCKLQRAKRIKNKMRYSLKISHGEDFLKLHGISFYDGKISSQISNKINHRIQRKKDFVSGFFLGAGSISDPTKSYHLEFLCKEEEQAKNLVDLLNDLEIKAKYIKRMSLWLVYIKDSEIIADLLSVMGADAGRFRYEDTKIIKNFRNIANRQVNCDTANLAKIADVSKRQVEAIKLIKEKVGLDSLTPKLREAAELRFNEPELSLEDLGKLFEPPLGKSGVNHRLKRIEKIAKDLLIEAKHEGQDD